MERDDTYMDIIQHIAELTAKRKLLPFIGAGCSKAMLDCDWDSVIKDMSAELGTEVSGHLEVAQEYVDRYGKEGLCEFLKKRFLIDEFQEEKGSSHMAVMCNVPHIIYTTNQDNVMEKCFERFGRKIKPVVTLENLIEAYPDELLYIKFHGDLSVPDSVVFTRNDYEERMKDSSHFLDIRLRSDMLGRQLLFIGYSFRDENIQQLFCEIQKVAGGKLPPSYLIAFSADDEFVERCKSYNIEVIVPQQLFPELSAQEAFDRFLSDWNTKTFQAFTSDEIHDMFSPGRRVCSKIITPVECKEMVQVLPELPLKEAIKKFRGLVDRAQIPKSQEEVVAGIFFDLCRRCDSQELVDEFQGASFNLLLTDPKLVFYQSVYVYTLANLCETEGMALYYIHMPHGFNRKIGVFVGAYAISLLRKWNRPISKFFQESLIHLCDDSVKYDSYGAELANFCREQYGYVWKEYKTTLENPLHRQKRVDAPLKSLFSKDYNTILNEMMQSLPKELR